MLKVIVNGCLGKMGKVLTRCVKDDNELELVCGVSFNPTETTDYKIYSTMNDIEESADVIIDFSHHSALDDLLSYALRTKTPLVIATTGYNDDELNKIKEACKTIPIFLSYNMSLRIRVVFLFVKKKSLLSEWFFIIWHLPSFPLLQ